MADPDAPDFGEPWTLGSDGCFVTSRDKRQLDYSRIPACVNACHGMVDPATELAALRAENAELLKLNQKLVREVELYRDRDFDEVGDDLK